MPTTQDRPAVAVSRIRLPGRPTNVTCRSGLTSSSAAEHFNRYLSPSERGALACRALDVLAAVNAADRAAGVAPRGPSARGGGDHAWLRRLAATGGREDGGD